MGFILFYKPSKIWVGVALLTWPSFLAQERKASPDQTSSCHGAGPEAWPVPVVNLTNPWGNGELVGGLEHEFYDFPYIGNVTNWRTHIFQRGRYTTNQRIILRHPKILRYAHQIPMLRKWSPHSWYVWSCHGKWIIQYVYLDLRMGDQSGWIAGFLLLIPDTGLEYPLLI